jgi:hypothetical protein
MKNVLARELLQQGCRHEFSSREASAEAGNFASVRHGCEPSSIQLNAFQPALYTGEDDPAAS